MMYRAYLLTSEGRILGFQLLNALNDELALDMAATIRACCTDIEVWEGARIVGRVKPREMIGGGKIEPELLAAVMEQMGQGFAIFDNNDRLIVHNPRFAALRAQIGREIVTGVSWRDLAKASLDQKLVPEALGRENQWLRWRRNARGTYTALRELTDGSFWQVDERRLPSGVMVVWTDVTMLMKERN